MNGSQLASFYNQWSELQLITAQITALQAGTATASAITLSISGGPNVQVPIPTAAATALNNGLLTILQARQTALQNLLTVAGLTLA